MSLLKDSGYLFNTKAPTMLRYTVHVFKEVTSQKQR